jgi:hypothetical protein
VRKLAQWASQLLLLHGFDKRIDMYITVVVPNDTVAIALGRPHHVRMRIKITGSSLLFSQDPKDKAGS